MSYADLAQGLLGDTKDLNVMLTSGNMENIIEAGGALLNAHSIDAVVQTMGDKLSAEQLKDMSYADLAQGLLGENKDLNALLTSGKIESVIEAGEA